MKKFLLAVVLILSLVMPSIQPAKADAVSDALLARTAAYGSTVVFSNRNAVFIYDLDTKQAKQIATNSNGQGFGGLSVLKDGIYWAENTVAPALKKYSFASQTISTIAQFGNFGEAEKKCPVFHLQMLNTSQVLYSLYSPTYASECNVTNKVYNLNTNTSRDAQSLLALTGDGNKVNTNFGTTYQIQHHSFDGRHIWGIYSGAKPGATGYTPETVVNYYRILDINSGAVVEAPYSGLDPNVQYNSVGLALRPVVADPTQGRVILSREKKTGPTYFVYNVNSNSTEKELGANFSASATGQLDLINTLSVNNLNVLTENYTKKEMHYYDAVANTTCSVTGDRTRYLHDFYIPMEDKPEISLVHRGRILKFSADSSVVADEVICGKSSTPAQNPVTQTPVQQTPVSTGGLIKAKNNPSVYYYGADGKRYVFYNEDLFKSWYSNFSGVRSISPSEMAAIKIGGNVTYRPGALVKISSDPTVYAVDKGGVLRALASESVARDLYGATWARQIKTIPDFLFVNYVIGNSISRASDFNPNEAKAWVKDINTDKNL